MAGEVQSGRLRALIVDDNAGQRRMIGEVLASFGASADFAQDGHEALTITLDIRYDLILMDISMPRMDGLCATRLIRAREKARAQRPTPLYIVTSHDDEEHRRAASDAGADGHIAKPTAVSQLIEALQHGLDMKAA